MSQTRRGFTLIELLIVVVVIGILAALAIPRFQSTKGKAYYAGMRSDLHNLTTAEEAYFYDHSAYSTVVGSARHHSLLAGISILGSTIENAGGPNRARQ